MVVQKSEEGATQLDTRVAGGVGANVRLEGEESFSLPGIASRCSKGRTFRLPEPHRDQSRKRLASKATALWYAFHPLNRLRSPAPTPPAGRAASISGRAPPWLEGSILLDASLDSKLRGTIAMDGGSLALGASRISIGNAPEGTGGLVLTAEDVASLKVDELILGSRSDLSLFGDVNMKLGRLVIRGAGFLGHAGAGQAAGLDADSIRLENPDGASSTNVGQGSGSLELSARQIELGTGDVALQGFAAASMTASERVVGDGRGRLSSSTDLAIATVQMTGTQGADTTIDATGHGVEIRSLTGTVADSGALGARLAVTADRIDHAGSISMPAGTGEPECADRRFESPQRVRHRRVWAHSPILRSVDCRSGRAHRIERQDRQCGSGPRRIAGRAR